MAATLLSIIATALLPLVSTQAAVVPDDTLIKLERKRAASGIAAVPGRQ